MPVKATLPPCAVTCELADVFNPFCSAWLSYAYTAQLALCYSSTPVTHATAQQQTHAVNALSSVARA